jgi:hypothetical protein
MQDILFAQSPYGLIHEATSLITTVEGVNAALLAAHRTETCEKIDAYLTEITQDMDAAHGDATLRSLCLAPLQTLRTQVAGETSIAHIVQAAQQALTCLDTAQGHIQAFLVKGMGQPSPKDIQPAPSPKDLQAASPTKSVTPVSQHSTSVVKKVHPIRPAEFVTTTYLETPAEAEAFLNALKRALDQALANGERIHIR